MDIKLNSLIDKYILIYLGQEENEQFDFLEVNPQSDFDLKFVADYLANPASEKAFLCRGIRFKLDYSDPQKKEIEVTIFDKPETTKKYFISIQIELSQRSQTWFIGSDQDGVKELIEFGLTQINLINVAALAKNQKGVYYLNLFKEIALKKGPDHIVILGQLEGVANEP